MFRFIWILVRPYRSTLFTIFVAMLIETVTSLASPWPLKIILDNVFGGHKLPHWADRLVGPWINGGTSQLKLAGIAALAFILIAVLAAVASYVDSYFTESVGQRVAHDLRTATYHHLQKLSMGYYNTHETGALLSTITTDVGTIQSFASSSTLNIVVDLMTIVCILGLMLWLNWDFTLIAIAVMPFLLLFVGRFKKAVKSATHEVRIEQSEIVAVVQQGLESMQVVKAFGREDNQEKLLEAVSRATMAVSLKARSVKSLLSPAVSVTVAGCTALVLWRGAALALSGRMTIGSLTVYLVYLNMFFKPVKDLAATTSAIAQAAVGIDRIRAVLDTDAVTPEDPDAEDLTIKSGEIVLDHVAFAYDATAPVLEDISFKIKPGQFVGIVGPTGSGKSTIISLLPRLYDALDGSIRIDGQDIRRYTLKSLRKHIGYVLQDTVLFRGTLAENIAFGRPDATREEIVEAARCANADDFIMAMPKAYDTVVGERGSTLSGGQRQRIGIARVMVRDSPILLLDEPTAALDSESEKLVMQALATLMKGRTVITIAHRLSTIHNADQIIVISGGKVAENGTHHELMRQNGVYAQLYQTQYESGHADAPALATTL